MTEELKLSWLVVNPMEEARVPRKSLLDAVHFSGRNPSRKEMQVSAWASLSADLQAFCSSCGTDTFTFDDFVRLCESVETFCVVYRCSLLVATFNTRRAP